MLRLFAVLLLCFSPAVMAGESQIVATVGEDIITTYDVQQHTALALVSSGIKDSAEARQKFAPRSLQGLINETLQRQEGERLGLKVSGTELAQAMAGLEKQNGMPPGGLRQLLAREDIPYAVLEKQVSASILWAKAVQRRYGGRINVSDAEVDALYSRLKASTGQPEYQLAEIVLPFADTAQEASVKGAAQQLTTQLKQGASFPALARQFSQSASAATGGDRGWLNAEDLPPELRGVVPAMQPGQLSPPLRTEDAYYILYLRSRRATGASTATASDDATASLYQIVFPPLRGSSETRTSEEKALRAKTGGLRGCAAADTFAKENALASSGGLGTLKLRDMPPPLRQAVLMSQDGMALPPAWLQSRHVVFVVCARTGIIPGKSAPLPTRDAVKERLRGQAIERFADQYLQQLRRGTLLEVKP